jgi:hypothetical protein
MSNVRIRSDKLDGTVRRILPRRTLASIMDRTISTRRAGYNLRYEADPMREFLRYIRENRIPEDRRYCAWLWDQVSDRLGELEFLLDDRSLLERTNPGWTWFTLPLRFRVSSLDGLFWRLWIAAVSVFALFLAALYSSHRIRLWWRYRFFSFR